MMSPRPAQEQLSTSATLLAERFRRRDATVGVVGLGYAGLPMANLLGARGFRVLGFDTDESRIEMLNAGKSYIQHLRVNELRASHAEGRFIATGDFRRLDEADALLVCVPTPLDRHREPDPASSTRPRPGSPRTAAAGNAGGARIDDISRDVPRIVRPILERSGLRCGEDFFLAYSPEREDPATRLHTTATIPRVVGGDGGGRWSWPARSTASSWPSRSGRVHRDRGSGQDHREHLPRSQHRPRQRAQDDLRRDGHRRLAGHRRRQARSRSATCRSTRGPASGVTASRSIPFYLAWKAREYGVHSRFIELAGEINSDMPRRVVERLARAIDRVHGRGLRESRILILGVAYKPTSAMSAKVPDCV